ncbi:hypothetical protein Tco_1397376, partial [Tanacetum coccineum]
RRRQMASLLSCNRPNPPEAQRPLLEDLSCNYLRRLGAARCNNSNTSLYLEAASRNIKAAKIGYTNDRRSTLLKQLPMANILIEDRLFSFQECDNYG